MTAQILSVASAFPDCQADLDYATMAAQAMSCTTEAEAGKLAKLYRRTGVQTRGSVLLQRTDDGQVYQTFYPPLTSLMNESETDHDALRSERFHESSGMLETDVATQTMTSQGPTMRTRNDRFAVEAPLLACRSAAAALAAAQTRPSQITHVVTVSCTGFTAPGLDVALIKRLHLPATTQRVSVGFMGCHGLINGLRTARGLVAADPDARVLLSSVELCSLHYQYGYDAQKIVSGSIFADGSAGLVIAGSGTRVDDRVGQIVATGSCLMPDCEDAMTWKIGDHGFEMTLEASVPGLIETHLREYLVDWLAGHDETLTSIGGWAVHPGGSRILQAVETALELPADALDISREILRRHGNMSSATLGAVLGGFIEHDVPGPWLMLGFGPGLEIEVALIR